MKKRMFGAVACLLVLLQLMLALQARASGPVTISQVPVDTSSIVPPNIVFVVDNSGSMDWEVLMSSNGGELWWNTSTQSFTDSSGVPLTNGNAGYVYLFPNGDASSVPDARYYRDSSGYYAVPPIPAFAWTRSSSYNPLYYNPAITYTPWVPAYINGASQSFTDAVPTAARSHPWLPTSGTPTTLDLTTLPATAPTATDYTFRMQNGMTIPGSSIAGIQANVNGTGWQPITTDITLGTSTVSVTTTRYGRTTTSNVTANGPWDVAIPYFPASYWVIDATCTSGPPSCATAPDGQLLRLYQIQPATTTYPSGRTYAAELQNFANWFTYYRKRKLMLAGAMGQVLSQLPSIHGGSVFLDSPSPITMYDFASPVASQNWQMVLGPMYTMVTNSGTPTRTALGYAGAQMMTNKSIIQFACQRNAAMVLTDGYADNSGGPRVGSYNKATYTGTPPYTTTYSNTLADIAAYYYTTNLRSDLLAGQVAYDTSDTSPNADKNRNLHMNTYAMTLGAIGNIYGTGLASALNPYANPPTWTNPSGQDPTAIDDLWHATINGRGTMMTATDAATAAATVQAAILDVIIKSGSQSAVAVSKVNLTPGNSEAYVSSYQVNGWFGDVQAFSVDSTTADISSGTPLWDGQALLDARTPASRLIVTMDGANGPEPFETANLSAATLDLLNLSTSPADNANVLAYLRGARNLEGTTYRKRLHLLGDIVYSEPEVVAGAAARYTDSGYAAFATAVASRQGVLYVGAGDGMLHAFNTSTGAEMWDYIPSFVLPSLKNLASPSYAHQFFVDGSPVSGDVDFGNTLGGSGTPDWHTLLVGGLRAGGNGFYALDVTSPVASSEVDLATKVLWEFPNSSTPTTVADNVGMSFGKPVIAKIDGYGWVVMVTSGYNNTAGDGLGHLFVLNAKTGALIADVPTSAGTAVSPSGLGQISAFAANAQVDATTSAVYGGDLLGNVWRFNLSGDDSTWTAVKLASLADASGNTQPITTAPELSNITTNAGKKRVVLVGTGKLLSAADMATTSVQSFYGLVDDMTSTPLIASPVRAALGQDTATINGTKRVITGTVDYATQKGWYIDLPGTGERISTDPIGAFGAIMFTSNQPSTAGCASNSYLYAISMVTGTELPPPVGTTAVGGQLIGNALASRPVVVVTSTGQVRVLAHESNNTVANVIPPISASNPARRAAWKEISR